MRWFGNGRRPATNRERVGDAELIFFVALAAQRSKRQILAVGQIEQRTSGGYERRRLIKVAVKGVNDPLDSRDFYG